MEVPETGWIKVDSKIVKRVYLETKCRGSVSVREEVTWRWIQLRYLYLSSLIGEVNEGRKLQRVNLMFV